MDYKQTENWILDRLPFYQSHGSKAYKPGLDKIKYFVDHLNLNIQDEKLIHIGGTNGKGSTCAYLSSIIQESGYNVGIFTSKLVFAVYYRQPARSKEKIISFPTRQKLL